MTKNIGWELYRSFLSVVREGSLSGAARALGLTQPTVGRHIESLEKSLNLTLFVRSQSGLQPTEAAQALRPLAEEMACSAAALERAASHQGEGICGTVRITASEVIGVEVLPPTFAHLSDKHPKLQLKLALSNRSQDLLHREADIAVRMFRPRQTQLIARKIGAAEVGLYAREDYIKRHGLPGHPRELQRYTLIGFEHWTDYLRQATSALPAEFKNGQFDLASDSDLAQLALIRAGSGIGFCQAPLARRDKNLVRVLPNYFSLSMDIWITMHKDLRNTPSCRAVFDALVSGLERYLKME